MRRQCRALAEYMSLVDDCILKSVLIVIGHGDRGEMNGGTMGQNMVAGGLKISAAISSKSSHHCIVVSRCWLIPMWKTIELGAIRYEQDFPYFLKTNRYKSQ